MSSPVLRFGTLLWCGAGGVWAASLSSPSGEMTRLPPLGRCIDTQTQTSPSSVRLPTRTVSSMAASPPAEVCHSTDNNVIFLLGTRVFFVLFICMSPRPPPASAQANAYDHYVHMEHHIHTP